MYNCTGMARRPIVIDASAVIAVITNEAHRPALIKLTRGADLLSPVSLPIEIGNAFSAMFKRERISLEAARAAIAAYRSIVVRLTAVDLVKSLELSHQLKIYAYDAYLLACCLEHRAPLLSLDGGLHEAAKRARVDLVEVQA